MEVVKKRKRVGRADLGAFMLVGATSSVRGAVQQRVIGGAVQTERPHKRRAANGVSRIEPAAIRLLLNQQHRAPSAEVARCVGRGRLKSADQVPEAATLAREDRG